MSVRGVRAYGWNEQILNLESMLTMIETKGVESYVLVNEHKITQTKLHDIVNKYEEKTFAFEHDKGSIDWSRRTIYALGF